jgi:hypothetical protein
MDFLNRLMTISSKPSIDLKPSLGSKPLRGLISHSVASLFSITALAVVFATSSLSQTISDQQMRAANIARMQAELINGGLGKYSPSDCMHQGGVGGDMGNNQCLVSSSPQGYRFRFLGGIPGWAARRERASVETVVLVSPDGKNLQVEYNGPVRIQ